jgi:hypothetical protein
MTIHEIASKSSIYEANHQETANLLRLLRAAPPKYMPYIPKIHKTVSPASKLTPPPIPSRPNMGLANRTAPAANALRTKPFAAKRDPEYRGYENGKYMNMHWIIMKTPDTA